MKNKIMSRLAPRNPLLEESEIIRRFGDCKFSCELTYEPSWFHTIKTNDFTIFIEEWFEEESEICSTVFRGNDQNVNFYNTNLDLLLNEIEEFIKSNS